jgi:Dolichyl-phosphate-mannose-protein mannosyltransferase
MPPRAGATLGTCFVLAVASAASVALNTDLMATPRFDGAGYSVLGEALASGRGYREIDKPESPRHAHFPPGYPAALALLWHFAGRSLAVAHLFSFACTVTAVLLAWQWFRTLYPPRTAFILGLSLALNWTWARIGGSIQSEPFYLLCELLVILAAVWASRRESIAAAVVLGVILASCILIRHVGVCVAAAVITDLAMRGQWRALRTAAPIAVVLILPWAVWLLAVHQHTQVGLLVQEGAAARIAGQAMFYLQRLPDQIHGPLVEVATVFRRSVMIAVLANLWAIAASVTIIWGWVSTLKTPRRRLAGLSALTTLSLLLIWPFTEAGRFLIPIVPFLLVGATEGIARVVSFARLRRSRLWVSGIVLAASVPYAAYAIATGRAEAQRQTHADFDAACAWIAQHASRPGPVLTRHPGEVFWQTGRLAVAPDSPDPEAVDRLIDRLGVPYLLIDEDRYAHAASNPLRLYVERYPSRSALIWGKIQGTASIQIREAIRPN